MNLHEDINRIQLLLTENREEMIKNMISKHGLHHVIKLMGGYDRILNTIGHEYFTNDDKINFIRETIGYLSKKYNTLGISTYELGMSPVTFGTPDPYSLEFQQIEYFSPEFVIVDVYGTSSRTGHFKEKYEYLDYETLDNVFIFMIDALEKYM